LAISFVLPALVPMWKLTSPQIGSLLGALAFGWVAQRYGRIKAMVWSVLVLSITSLAWACAAGEIVRAIESSRNDALEISPRGFAK
jgi:MFS transporter, putative metabolite:H+ symporter